MVRHSYYDAQWSDLTRCSLPLLFGPDQQLPASASTSSFLIFNFSMRVAPNKGSKKNNAQKRNGCHGYLMKSSQKSVKTYITFRAVSPDIF